MTECGSWAAALRGWARSKLQKRELGSRTPYAAKLDFLPVCAYSTAFYAVFATMDAMPVDLHPLRPEDLPRIAETSGGPAWNASQEKWARYLAEQEHGARQVLLADTSDAIVAYASLISTSQNASFRGAGIPEIQDLVVAEACRNLGLATRMILALEERARAAGHTRIGIGVGLYRDYGPAQRLYSKLGYALDGEGVSYNNAAVAPGSMVKVDDGLVMWMVKPLKKP